MQLENKNDTNPNQTAKDAYARMDVARWGSLVKESGMEYLYRLQSEVKEWLEGIACEIQGREREEARLEQEHHDRMEIAGKGQYYVRDANGE